MSSPSSVATIEVENGYTDALKQVYDAAVRDRAPRWGPEIDDAKSTSRSCRCRRADRRWRGGRRDVDRASQCAAGAGGGAISAGPAGCRPRETRRGTRPSRSTHARARGGRAGRDQDHGGSKRDGERLAHGPRDSDVERVSRHEGERTRRGRRAAVAGRARRVGDAGSAAHRDL